jgi:hypothetical protein
MESQSERSRRLRQATGTPPSISALTKEHSRIGVRRSKNTGSSPSAWIFMLCFGGCLILLLHSTQQLPSSSTYYEPLESMLPSLQSTVGWDEQNPLAIPKGQAPNLPSLRTNGVDNQRKGYGGHGDRKHLGGFTEYDGMGVSPHTWKHMIQDYGVHSLLDVGCGRGTSTAWFLMHGVDVLCVEGSHDAIERSVIPDPATLVVEHDFSRGPWWPAKTYDAAWAVEFLEHVNVQYHFNYVTAFRKAALIFVSTSQWGGWHHVEVHGDEWWIRKYEAYGFKYDASLTTQVRKWAREEKSWANNTGPDGKPHNAQHIWLSMKVFVNPIVAALPQHAHLFPEDGCFLRRGDDGEILHKECGTGKDAGLETPLAQGFRPLALNPAMDQRWLRHIQKHASRLHEGKEKDEASPDDDETSAIQSEPTRPADLLRKIDEKNITDILPLHVVVWPYLEHGIRTAEHQHIEENGISESSYLRLSKDMMDFHPNVVWLGDIGWGFPWKEWCQEYTKHIKKAKNMRREKGLPEQWPIFIVAFTDGPSLPRCQNVEAEVGKANVRYTSRSIVYNRRWNEAKKWVETGEKLNMMKSGIIYRHMPLVVRTDTVKFLEEALRKRNMTLADPVERLQRDVDVAHYWPHQRDLDKVGTVGSLLRQEISKLLFAFGKNTNFNVFVGLKGEAVRKGRRGVASDYIESLLETKIVVVSQRDRWEDHYRLMEALVGGALVLTDRVLGMPAGLENGTSVVEYDSADSLLSLIQHYLTHTEERLSIARKGREAAMKKHRTWHRIEEIIFGESLSDCRFQGSDSPCPYVVHGVESKR